MKLHRRSLILEFYKNNQLHFRINGKNSTTKQINVDATITKYKSLSQLAKINIKKLSHKHYQLISSANKVKVIAGWIDDSIPFKPDIENAEIFYGEIINWEFTKDNTSIIASVQKNVKKTTKELEAEAKLQAEKDKKANAEIRNREECSKQLTKEQLSEHKKALHAKKYGKTGLNKEMSKKTQTEQDKMKKFCSVNVQPDTTYQKLFKQAHIDTNNINQQLLQTKVFPDLEKPESIVTYTGLIEILNDPNHNSPFYITKDEHKYTAHAYTDNDIVYLKDNHCLTTKPTVVKGTWTFNMLLQGHLDVNKLINLEKLQHSNARKYTHVIDTKPKIDEKADPNFTGINIDSDMGAIVSKKYFVITKVIHTCSNYEEKKHITTVEMLESNAVSLIKDIKLQEKMNNNVV